VACLRELSWLAAFYLIKIGLLKGVELACHVFPKNTKKRAGLLKGVKLACQVPPD